MPRCLPRGVVVGVLLALLLEPAAAQSIPPRAYEHRRDLIRLSRSVWGMNAPISDLAAQLHQESLWNPKAVSPAGAQGMAQFMPATAKWMASLYGEAPNPFDARWSMLYQSRYMKRLHDAIRNSDNACEQYAFALAAYNGGLGWVNKRRAMSDTPGICMGAACAINPGVASWAQRENEHYPRRILRELSPLYYEAQWGPSRCVP